MWDKYQNINCTYICEYLVCRYQVKASREPVYIPSLQVHRPSQMPSLARELDPLS